MDCVTSMLCGADHELEELDYDPAAVRAAEAERERTRPRCRCGRPLKCYVYDGRCEDCWVATSPLCRSVTKASLSRDGAPPATKHLRDASGPNGQRELTGEPSLKNAAYDLADLASDVIKADRAAATVANGLSEQRLTAGERQAANRREMIRRMFPRLRRAT